MPILLEPSLATALIVLFLASWRFIPRRRIWIELATTTALFVLLSVVVINSDGSPLNPRFDHTSPVIELWNRLIAAAWWLLGARTIVAIGSAIVLAGRRSREAKLASDLISGGVYLASLLIIVSTVFNVPIGGLVATSGVIAIVLGLALQNTLADVFAGIAVEIEGPVALGDRVWIEGPVEGEIVQINWRSIHIRTDSNDIAIIPHSVIAKSRIVNRSHPTARRSDSVQVSCDATVQEDLVVELLRRALLLCPGILREPAPAAALVRLGAHRNKYELSFSAASSPQLGSAKTALMREVARQFRYEGIQPSGHLPRGQTWQGRPDRAMSDRAVSGQGRSNQARLEQAHPEQNAPDQVAKDPRPGNGSLPEDSTAASGVVAYGAASPAPALYSPDRLFGELSMFYALSTAHRRQIVEQLICRVLQPQDILFSQGATEASLFIIASGVLEVTRKVGETLHVVGRIGPGDYIGEIGLLTGAPHAATVTALTRCVIYELRKSVIAPILAEEPNLVSAFEASARHGQELLARAAAAATCPHAGSPGQLLARIRAFFDLPAH